MTLMPGDRSGDRLEEAQAARLERAAAAAKLDWGDSDVTRAADVLWQRATLQLTAGGGALVLGWLAGRLDGRGLAAVGLIALVSIPVWVAVKHRLIPRNTVTAAPSRFRVIPAPRRGAVQWVLQLGGVWALLALLLVLDARTAAHVLVVPLAMGPTNLVLLALTRRWEHRHDRELLIRVVDGDDLLYARPRSARSVAGLPAA